MSEKIALEKRKHIVEVYPCEVDGYIKDGWTLLEEAKPTKPKTSTKKVK